MVEHFQYPLEEKKNNVDSLSQISEYQHMLMSSIELFMPSIPYTWYMNGQKNNKTVHFNRLRLRLANT